MEPKWNIVNNQEDINYVLNHFGFFHDACLKEAKYISGSFVSENYSMKPIDDIRQVHIIIQKQNKDHAVIEFLFEGVERFNLVPAAMEYDSIISGILLKQKERYVYFADYEIDIDEFEKNSNWLTWIRAKSVKWREVNRYIGNSLIFQHRDF